MSFSCPHFRPDGEYCLRLKIDCVPGRRGCVVPSKTVFATPVEERIRIREEEKIQRATENFEIYQNPNARAKRSTKH